MAFTSKQEKEIIKKIANELFRRHGDVLDGHEVNGELIGLQFIDEVQSGSAFHYRRNGKVQIRVGTLSFYIKRSVGFKQKADGTHNYDKIADKLHEMVTTVMNERKLKDKQDAKRVSCEDAVERIARKFGKSRYGVGLEVSRSGGLAFRKGGLTEEQAEAFVALAFDLNLLS